jgi:hypothetical protein
MEGKQNVENFIVTKSYGTIPVEVQSQKRPKGNLLMLYLIVSEHN